jgi:hypothetical protein
LITTGISIWYIDRASCRRAARGERGGTEDLAPCNEANGPDAAPEVEPGAYWPFGHTSDTVQLYNSRVVC